MKITQKKGFTLLEIIVVVAIFSLIVDAIFTVFNIGQNTFFSNEACLHLQQNLRLSMDGMIREIRQSSASDITISSGGSKIVFKIPLDITTDPVTKSADISYSLVSGQIIRENPAGTQKVIANDITSLTFTQSGNNVEISISASDTLKQRTYTQSLKESVLLRN